MTGVDILAVEEVVTEYAFGWTWFSLIAAAVGCVAIVLFIRDAIRDGFDGQLLLFTLLIIVMGFILGAAVGVVTRKPIEYESRYKVTISDEVKMADFLEKYEIIDTEGKIYTVREREAE